MKFGAVACALVAGGVALTPLALCAEDLKPEQITVARVPARMKRVYVMDPVLPHMVDGRVYVLDAKDLTLKGMMESGFAGMMAAAPDKGRVYVAASFYARLTRGARTDVIQVYDDETLKVIDEIPVPTLRAQALPYRNLFRLNSDGSMIFAQNATPATSVTVVDVASKKNFEAQGPGCYGIYPALANPLRFATLCGDGTATTYTISSDHASAQLKSSAKFFDPQSDPLYTHAEPTRDGYVFLTYSGKLMRLAVDGDTVAAQPAGDAAEGQKGWAPGGYQPFTVDAQAGVAYLLMHDKAVEGSHKAPSVEIWAYDLNAKKLLARSPVAGLIGVTLSASEPNILFGIDGVANKIVRLAVDPQSRNITPAGEIKLGETAALIEAPR